MWPALCRSMIHFVVYFSYCTVTIKAILIIIILITWDRCQYQVWTLTTFTAESKDSVAGQQHWGEISKKHCAVSIVHYFSLKRLLYPVLQLLWIPNPRPSSWCAGGRRSWNGQWTAAKRRSAALTLSGYFCTNSRTLLALPWAASMTNRLGLSGSVDWDSSFSSTEMTDPGDKGTDGRQTERHSLRTISRTGRAGLQMSLQKAKIASHGLKFAEAELNEKPQEWVKMSLHAHTHTCTHATVCTLPSAEVSTCTEQIQWWLRELRHDDKCLLCRQSLSLSTCAIMTCYREAQQRKWTPCPTHCWKRQRDWTDRRGATAVCAGMRGRGRAEMESGERTNDCRGGNLELEC